MHETRSDEAKGIIASPQQALLTFLLAVCFVCSGVTGCTSSPAADSRGPALTLGALAVVPMNLDYPLAKEFGEGKVLVSATLRQYLEATGQQATFLDRSDVESKWAEAVGSVGGIVDEKRKWIVEARYAMARSAFAGRVAAETGADQVLMPSLMVREGRYSGTNLRWDGVMRRLDMKNQNPHASTRISGKDLALSIRVSIFDADGELVFEQLGGIEPITAYEHTAGEVTEMDSGSVKRRIRDDLFEDDAILRDSVRVALTPLIEAPQGWLP